MKLTHKSGIVDVLVTSSRRLRISPMRKPVQKQFELTTFSLSLETRQRQQQRRQSKLQHKPATLTHPRVPQCTSHGLTQKDTDLDQMFKSARIGSSARSVLKELLGRGFIATLHIPETHLQLPTRASPAQQCWSEASTAGCQWGVSV
eukprot:6203499-Amphidinium_carterae.2